MITRTLALVLSSAFLLVCAATAQTNPPAAPPPSRAQTDAMLRETATTKFKAADKNGDGFLDDAEIEAEAGAHFKAHDRDNKGALDVAAECRGKRKAKKPECEHASHDTNRDGRVTPDEHHGVMRRALLGAADRDRDGKVSLEEYLAWSVRGARQSGRAR